MRTVRKVVDKGLLIVDFIPDGTGASSHTKRRNLVQFSRLQLPEITSFFNLIFLWFMLGDQEFLHTQGKGTAGSFFHVQ